MIEMDGKRKIHVDMTNQRPNKYSGDLEIEKKPTQNNFSYRFNMT